jgi:hypothetical protein
MEPEVSDKQLFLGGYAYQRDRISNRRAYWVCKRMYRRECTARAITSDPADGVPVVVFKGPDQSEHQHPPNVEENIAAKVRTAMKRKAADHPEQPPAQLLRMELQDQPDDVLSQLPSQPALVRALQRVRKKEFPRNPRSLHDLKDIPDKYTKTLLGEQFLLYDSGPPEEAEDTENEEEEIPPDPDFSRVIVYATRKNIELLCESPIWFLDGTFKTSPNIFAQLFTIIGLRQRAGHPEETVAVPLVYAFLTGKKTEQYEEVLRVVRDAVNRFNINACVPTKLMTDFELAIINASKAVFPHVPISCCFFHLGQIIYRRIQEDGLQQQYRDPLDRTVKRFTHMLLALAFVPAADVPDAFAELRRECPPELHTVFDSFSRYYISGTPARGRRRGRRPTYRPALWNQYQTAIEKSHRTNNVSEGWHNRFRLVVGKHHPDLYTAITEIQKEQGYMEICITELAMGKKVKTSPTKKWIELQDRLESIAAQYASKPIMEYLRAIAANVAIS